MSAEGLTGLNGAVLIGGANVASIREWTWTRESTTVDTGGFGDVYEKTRVTRKRGSGSFRGLWAKGDATGQGAVEDAYENSDLVSLSLQLESGKVYVLNAYLSQLEAGAQYDGATTFNCSFVQYGAPTSMADHS